MDSQTEHVALGTWKKCNENGSYSEYKITDQYFLIIHSDSDKTFDRITLFKNEIHDSIMILSGFDGGIDYPFNDTLFSRKISDSKIAIASRYNPRIILSKVNSTEPISPIDSTNIELWKEKTLTNFEKRAELENCPILETVKENETILLDIEEIELEEVETIKQEY